MTDIWGWDGLVEKEITVPVNKAEILYGCGYGCAYRQHNLASQSIQFNDCQTGQSSGKITLHIYKKPTDQKLFLKAFSEDLFKMSPGGSFRGPSD